MGIVYPVVSGDNIKILSNYLMHSFIIIVSWLRAF